LTNLAFGGAFTGHGNFLIGPLGPGLLDEITLFATLHPSGADPNSLYVVWAGANDFFAAPAPSTIGPAVTNLATAVGTLAGLGATHLLVFNMPDLGKTPDGLNSGFSAQLTALTLAFDGALASTLSGLGLPGLTEFDATGAMDQIIADPGAFGLTDVTTACLNLNPFSVCADPDQHLFWDSVHPTTRVHSILAAEVARAIPAPATIVLLGAGLVAATVAGRRWRRSPSRKRP
jgi:phospholipase/lecithinase/hemolysin